MNSQDTLSYLLSQRFLANPAAAQGPTGLPAHSAQTIKPTRKEVEAVASVSLDDIAEQLSSLRGDVAKLMKGSMSPIRGSGVKVPDADAYPAQEPAYALIRRPPEGASATPPPAPPPPPKKGGRQFKNATERVQWGQKMREAKAEKRRLRLLKDKETDQPPTPTTSTRADDENNDPRSVAPQEAEES